MKATEVDGVQLGGNCMGDFTYFEDGSLVCITDDAIGWYETEDDFWAGEFKVLLYEDEDGYTYEEFCNV